MDRRAFVTPSGAYALAALGLPDPDAVLRRVGRHAGGKVRAGRGGVTGVPPVPAALGDAAAELGGGHARHLAVRYLHHDVAPWLDGTRSQAIGRELRAATAQLVHL
ncbi:transcriptional regulator, partial [Streptomyces rubellomurinus subsp. indigoferus]